MRRFNLIIIAYLLAAVVAALVYLTISATPFWRILYADIAATLVIFGFSYHYQNSSFYDAYWSVAPIVIATTLLFTGSAGNSIRELVVLLLIALWGVRLTWNWGSGWQGIQHEDWRYIQLKAQTGRFYWLVSLLGIHLFPTVIVLVGCAPVFIVFEYPASLNAIDLAALVLTICAITLEWRADRELHRFRATRLSHQEILKTGVWAWCRHPNYLGEIGFWLGLFLFGFAAHGGATDLMKAGPICMILLFLIISIPMIDKKLCASKPGYDTYKRQSFALIPLPRFWR